LDILQSLVLGVTQGLTEFIPVSSTAHLILVPEFGINRPRPAIADIYDTFIQLGTVFPVLIFFWRDWLELLRAAVRIVRSRKIGDDLHERMVKYLVIGTIPAGLAGLALKDFIHQVNDPDHFKPAFLIIGIGLIGMGLVMWWVDHTARKTRSIEKLRTPDAVLMGIAQACALFPGVSRSGATITAGLLAGLTREAAARFSFLMMTPIMLLATGYQGVKALKGEHPLTADEWSGLLLATVVAGITGYFAIAFLLNWLRTRSVTVFAIWRIALGAFSLGLFFVRLQAGAAAPGSAAPGSTGRSGKVIQPGGRGVRGVEHGRPLGPIPASGHRAEGGRRIDVPIEVVHAERLGESLQA
jgi:undecaprenyl-diphosphatase